jgi:hypothetical protein
MLNVKKYFQYDRKLGWGDIVAATALIFSVYNWLQENKPTYVVAQEVGHNMDYLRGTAQNRTELYKLFYSKTNITNTGQIPFTVIGVSPSYKSYWENKFLVGVKNEVGKGVVVSGWPEALIEQEIVRFSPKVFLLEDTYTDFQTSPELMLSKNAMNSEQMMSINLKVEPGEQVTLKVGAVLDWQEFSEIDSLHFGYEIHLSSGISHEIASSYPVVNISTVGSDKQR